MSRTSKTKRQNAVSSIVVACDPIAEVWAVCDYGPECHADDCDCTGPAGSHVLALFISPQTADQYIERQGTGYKVRMPVNTSMKNVI